MSWTYCECELFAPLLPYAWTKNARFPHGLIAGWLIASLCWRMLFYSPICHVEKRGSVDFHSIELVLRVRDKDHLSYPCRGDATHLFLRHARDHIVADICVLKYLNMFKDWKLTLKLDFSIWLHHAFTADRFVIIFVSDWAIGNSFSFNTLYMNADAVAYFTPLLYDCIVHWDRVCSCLGRQQVWVGPVLLFWWACAGRSCHEYTWATKGHVHGQHLGHQQDVQAYWPLLPYDLGLQQ